MIIRVKKTITAVATFMSLMLTATSCSMMQEDRSDCPDCRNTLRIMLRYDYNTARANMFADHVKEATVYVVDPTTDTVVDTQTARNDDSNRPWSPSFAFNFEELAPGNYRLYATGRSKADATISTVEPLTADAISRLQFTVPVDSTGNVTAERLDTLWNTLAPVDIRVLESEPTEATIPLMRLTNDLNIVVFRRDGSLAGGHERYDVSVTDENVTLGYDNTTTATAPLVYRPFAAWTTESTVSDGSTIGTPDGSAVAERNAHYDLSLFRLVSHDDARRNARLIIRNRETAHEIVNIDLCHYLALARNAYETRHYGVQEYLDREYDYRLDFGIEGTGPSETWKYITISINVLSWSIRIQNEEL
ncbi:MAG: FimB/Mfa2 family fimbrial subunit [Prevotella sp.]|nr:FimB/Mfa2 family fimbrial subunit [Prevotella sp.]